MGGRSKPGMLKETEAVRLSSGSPRGREGKIREVSGENHVGSASIGPWKDSGFCLHTIGCYWRVQSREVTCSNLF